MSTGDARHGRRDNGLVAAEYAPAGDVDPRVGEHLLDVLALDGIAAYLRPSTDLHPVTRSTLLPSRPTDRLYVDRAHVATARDYLSRLAADAERAEQTAQHPTAELTGDEIEAAWAEIVAGYQVTADRGEGPPISPVPPTGQTPTGQTPTGQTSAEPTPAEHKEAKEEEKEVRYYRLTRAEEPSLLDGLDTFGADLPDDDSETFTPPVPPPVPRPSMPTALAVLGIVGGLAVFLQPELLSFLSPSLSLFLGFTAIVTGFGTLVWRLRPGDDEDEEDPDQGAKV
jgi:hypothetical protein